MNQQPEGTSLTIVKKRRREKKALAVEGGA